MTTETATGSHPDTPPGAPGTARRGALRWLTDRRTATKLLIAFLTVVALLAGVSVLALSKLSDVAEETTAMYEKNVIPLTHIAAARRASVTTELLVLKHGVISTPDGQAAVEAESAENDAVLDESITAYAPDAADPAAVEELTTALRAYRDFRDQELFPASRSNDDARFEELVTTREPELATPMFDALQRAFDAEKADAEQRETVAQAEYASARTTVITMLAVAVVVAVAIALGLGRLIARPLRRAVTVLEGLAAGRLDDRTGITGHDEVGRLASALDRALDGLSDAMREIAENATTLSAASEQLSATSIQVNASATDSAEQANTAAATADEVAHNVQTVAAGTEEMAASISEIAKNTAAASAVVAQAVEVTRRTASTVNQLSESSTQIGDVVKVITAVAEQTNLLALNATIEAARAGEAGKGFAVVAEEVKQLAQETGRATERIRSLIDAIRADATASVTAIDEITDIVRQVDATQVTIASAVEEQSATTQEMGRSVNGAATGASGIAANIGNVARAATQTTSGASDTAQAADELARLAGRMRDLTECFTY